MRHHDLTQGEVERMDMQGWSYPQQYTLWSFLLQPTQGNQSQMKHHFTLSG